MLKFRKYYVLLLVGLSACSTTSIDSVSGSLSTAAYEQMVSDVTGQGFTPPSEVPTEGEATHTGIMTGQFEFVTGTETVVGDASMTFDFENALVSGSFSNLQGSESGAISGTLVVQEANLPGPAFFSGVTGDINVAGNNAAVNASVGGTLYGSGVTGATGAITGDVIQTGFTGEVTGGYVVSAGGP